MIPVSLMFVVAIAGQLPTVSRLTFGLAAILLAGFMTVAILSVGWFYTPSLIASIYLAARRR